MMASFNGSDEPLAGSVPFRCDSHRYRGGRQRYHGGNSPVDALGRGV